MRSVNDAIQDRISQSWIPDNLVPAANGNLTGDQQRPFPLPVVDDLQQIPSLLSVEQRRDLLEIVEDRYEKGSLLVTSQIPVSRWHELIADPTIGDAILDRVVHRAHRIELKGPSLRKRHGVSAPVEGDSAAAAGG